MCDRCKEGRHCGLQTPGCRCKLCAGETVRNLAEELRASLQACMPPGSPDVPPIDLHMQVIVGDEVMFDGSSNETPQ